MNPIVQWLLGAAAVLLGAAVQGATGFGFAVLSVPLLAMVYGAHTAVIVGLVLSIVASFIMVFQVREEIDVRSLVRWTLYAFVGMPFGVWLFVLLDPRLLKLFIAIIVAVLSLLLLRGLMIPARRRTVLEGMAATSAGVLATSVGMAGPPMVLYASAAAYGKSQFRATLTSFGLATSILGLGALAISGQVSFRLLGLSGTLSVGILGGLLVGYLVHGRFNQEQFSRAVLVTLFGLAIITALGAL